jgi:hypothetical protein
MISTPVLHFIISGFIFPPETFAPKFNKEIGVKPTRQTAENPKLLTKNL